MIIAWAALRPTQSGGKKQKSACQASRVIPIQACLFALSWRNQENNPPSTANTSEAVILDAGRHTEGARAMHGMSSATNHWVALLYLLLSFRSGWQVWELFSISFACCTDGSPAVGRSKWLPDYPAEKPGISRLAGPGIEIAAREDLRAVLPSQRPRQDGSKPRGAGNGRRTQVVRCFREPMSG